MDERPYHQLKSVARAADVLLVFLKSDEWSISDISRELGLHKSVVHRLVATLARSGLLVQDARSGRYRIGTAVIHLGERYQRGGQLLRLARPHLEKLARSSGETASLQISQGDHGLCVDVVESSQTMRFTISPGHSFPLHAGCAGKVILAFREPEFVERLLSKMPLQRYTDFTITDPDELRAELARIRAEGVGFSEGEITPGARSVGVPLLAPNRSIVASLVLSGPSERMTDARVREHMTQLREAAKELSDALGYTQKLRESEIEHAV